MKRFPKFTGSPVDQSTLKDENEIIDPLQDEGLLPNYNGYLYIRQNDGIRSLLYLEGLPVELKDYQECDDLNLVPILELDGRIEGYEGVWMEGEDTYEINLKSPIPLEDIDNGGSSELVTEEVNEDEIIGIVIDDGEPIQIKVNDKILNLDINVLLPSKKWWQFWK